MNTSGSQITVRKQTFDVELGAGGLWNTRRPELSHMINAFQLALPYLEPYFIDAIRGAEERISDPVLKADAAAFCAQEANHSRQHKRYCRFLNQRYPRLREYEEQIQQSLVRSRREDSLEWRLAYTAGYEAITAQTARWMFRESERWFKDANPYFTALMTWHAAEEIEHRHVAFDVFRAVSTSYALRAKGLFAALKKTVDDMVPVATYMLEVDGYGGRVASLMRRAALRLEMTKEVLPALLRYLNPGYHPSHDAEPPGFGEWIRAAGAQATG